MNIILTNFVACIKSWILGYCIVNTKNFYLLKLALQNSSPNHALFCHSRDYQQSSALQMRTESSTDGRGIYKTKERTVVTD